MNIVCCDHSYAAVARDARERRQYLTLLGYAVVLKLYKEIIPAEYPYIFFGGSARAVKIAADKARRYLAGETRGQRDQPLVIF